MADLSEIETATESVLSELGYEAVEWKFEKEYGTDTLTLFIWKKGGVGLDDCEKVNDAINPILDALDFGESEYNFNVSSPGLDRPIVSEDDYRRNVGEDVEIVFLQPRGKQKSAHGILTAYDAETLTLSGKKDTVYEKNTASVIRPYISFNS